MDEAERRHLEDLYSKDPLRVLDAEHYHAGYFDSERDLPSSQTRYLEVLFEDCSIGRDGCVIDVGCGEGNTARWIRRSFGASVIGVDIVMHVLDRGRRRDDLALAQTDMASLPFRSRSVDVIVGVESVYHHSARADVFAEFARVLRPGGLLLLSEFLLEPNASRLAARVVSAIVESKSMSAEADYRQKLHAAGFEPTSIRDVGHLTAVGTARYLREHAALRHALFRSELGSVKGSLVSIGLYPVLYRIWCRAFETRRARQIFVSARRRTELGDGD
jgi:SAM-dependent methyltransferase